MRSERSAAASAWAMLTVLALVPGVPGQSLFDPPQLVPLPSSTFSTAARVRVADFDNDGWPDVVPGNDSRVDVFAGDGAGGLAGPVTAWLPPPAASPSLNLAHPVATGDLDLDGDVDVVVDTLSSGVRCLLGLGNGHFNAQAPAPAIAGGKSAFGDVDGDGVLDWAFASPPTGPTPQTLTLRRYSAGTFSVLMQHVPLPAPPAALTIGDFNGDGLRDVAVAALNAPGATLGGIWVVVQGPPGSYSVTGPWDRRWLPCVPGSRSPLGGG